MAEPEKKPKVEPAKPPVAEKQPPKEEPAAAPVAAKSGQLGLYITIAVVLILVPALTLGIAHFVLPKLKVASQQEQKETTDSEPIIDIVKKETVTTSKPGEKEPDKFSMTDLVVNIKGTRGTRFLRMGIQLDGSPPVQAELKNRKLQIMDIVSSCLSSKKLDDIESDDFRPTVRIEIKTLVNAVLKTGEVSEVYIPEMVVQ